MFMEKLRPIIEINHINLFSGLFGNRASGNDIITLAKAYNIMAGKLNEVIDKINELESKTL